MNHVAMRCQYQTMTGVQWSGVTANPIVRGADVMAVVTQVFGVEANEIKSQRRHHKLLRPRFAFCALAKEFTIMSYPQIGMIIGNRDHTTILHAIRRAARIYAHDGEFMAKMDECRRRLRMVSQ